MVKTTNGTAQVGLSIESAFSIRCYRSYPRARRDGGVLGDDDDAVAYMKEFAVHVVWLTIVGDDEVIANMDVFIDDCALDAAITADTWSGFIWIGAGSASIIVGTHDDDLTQSGARLNDGAHAYDGGFHMSIGDDAAFGDECFADFCTIDLGGRQETRMSENRSGRVEEVILGDDLAEIEIGLEEGADGADVLPVALKVKSMNLVLFQRTWNDVLAKVHAVIVEAVDECPPIENVNTHACLIARDIGGKSEGLEGFDRHTQVF